MEKELNELTQRLDTLSLQATETPERRIVQVKRTLHHKSIYVLVCADGKFYVGKTDKEVPQRFQEHVAGDGSAWTKMHTPHSIVEVLVDAPFIEDAKTLEYMRRHGVDNVRGGKY